MHNPDFGDCIGLESCVDTVPDFPPPPIRRRRREAEVAVEQPPPIPFLARIENRPSHMPWMMTRHYTGDGRLIITEERKRHHEYFEVHRNDGRLVLNLVPLDDVVDEFLNEGVDVSVSPGDEMDNGDGGTEEERANTHECYAYNGGVATNTCGGYVPAAVPAFRPPVHT